MLLEELQLSEEQVVERLESVREQLQQATSAQQQQQGDLQRLGGRLASLEALQQAALEPGGGAVDWLREQGLEQRPRLAEGLRVEPGWELAVETVLGADLQAVLLDDFAGLDFNGLEQGELRLLLAAGDSERHPGSLLDKVEGRTDLSPWLGRVLPVEDLAEALARRAALGEGETWSAVTATGLAAISYASAGVVRHKVACWPAARRSSAWGSSSWSLKPRWSRWNSSFRLPASSSWALKSSVSNCAAAPRKKAASTVSSRPAFLPAVRAEQMELRRRRLQEELIELQEQRALELEQLGEARLVLQEALDLMAQDTEQREQLMARRDTLREGLDRIRQEARHHKDHAHQLAVRLGSLRASTTPPARPWSAWSNKPRA